MSDDPTLATQRSPAIAAAPSGAVYVVWQENRNGGWDLYFGKSADGGSTWSPSKRIVGGDAPSGSTQDRPALALGPNGELVVAWEDDRLAYFDFDIFATVSYDAGETFAVPVKVSDAPPGTLQLAPTVAVGESGRIVVAWQDFRNRDGDLRASVANLSFFTFGPSARVDDDPGTGTQAAPSAAVASTGLIYVAYHDNRSGNANVYLAKSADGGRTFGANIRVDDTGSATTPQGLVSISVDGLGRIYAVWQDGRAGEVQLDGRPIFDIYSAVSTDGGASFSRNVRVDDGPKKSSQEKPRVAIGSAGTVYVVWDDARNTDWDPYFTYSTNGGTSFVSSIRVDDAGDSTTDPPLQYDPQVVESRTGLVFVAWEDDRAGTSDVYGATGYLSVGSALRVRVDLDTDTAWPGDSAAFTIRVTSNGTAVDGTSISLSADGSGSFGVLEWTGPGTYRSSFTTSPSTPDGTDVTITATAQEPGFVSGASKGLIHARKAIVASMEPTWDLLAVGQTMLVRVSALAHGKPLASAAATTAISWGGGMSPATGITDAQGLWSSWFTPSSSAGGSSVTISATLSKDGYQSATVSVTIPILAQPRTLDILAVSRTREMMSYERAAVSVGLSSDGIGVTKAILSTYCFLGGNFSAAQEIGGGQYGFSWNAPRVTTPAWAFLVVRAQRGGYGNVTARLTFLVDPNKTNPANPTSLFVNGVPQSTQVQGGHSLLVSVYAYTAEGYAVSGVTLTVNVAGGLGTTTAVVDELNGLYSFVYTAPHVTSNTGVLLLLNASKYGYATAGARVALLVLP